MNEKNESLNPRIIVIQKLYTHYLNKDSELYFPKHRYKKFIKDVVIGTIERKELIQSFIDKELENDIDLKKTDKLLKIIIYAAVFELLYKHNNPKKVIISEYLKASDSFIKPSQKNFLNAILDKASKISRDLNAAN